MRSPDGAERNPGRCSAARSPGFRSAPSGLPDRICRTSAALRAQLAEFTAATAAERAAFDAGRGKLLELMQHAESHIGKLTTELDMLRASVDSFNQAVVSVPIEVLRLARTQFDYLSSGFARRGDPISQAMSEIGGFAIDQALAAKPDPA